MKRKNINKNKKSQGLSLEEAISVIQNICFSTIKKFPWILYFNEYNDLVSEGVLIFLKLRKRYGSVNKDLLFISIRNRFKKFLRYQKNFPYVYPSEIIEEVPNSSPFVTKDYLDSFLFLGEEDYIS